MRNHQQASAGFSQKFKPLPPPQISPSTNRLCYRTMQLALGYIKSQSFMYLILRPWLASLQKSQILCTWSC